MTDLHNPDSDLEEMYSDIDEEMENEDDDSDYGDDAEEEDEESENDEEESEDSENGEDDVYVVGPSPQTTFSHAPFPQMSSPETPAAALPQGMSAGVGVGIRPVTITHSNQNTGARLSESSSKRVQIPGQKPGVIVRGTVVSHAPKSSNGNVFINSFNVRNPDDQYALFEIVTSVYRDRGMRPSSV